VVKNQSQATRRALYHPCRQRQRWVCWQQDGHIHLWYLETWPDAALVLRVGVIALELAQETAEQIGRESVAQRVHSFQGGA